jgi:hypothetical protein
MFGVPTAAVPVTGRQWCLGTRPGQHLMQAQSDIFLGWTRVANPDDGVDRDFYVRQLRDWKFSVPIEQMLPEGMELYARLCGWTLAPGARPFR